MLNHISFVIHITTVMIGQMKLAALQDVAINQNIIPKVEIWAQSLNGVRNGYKIIINI